MCDHGEGDGAREERAGRGGCCFFFIHCCFPSQIYEITSWWFSYSNFRYEFTGVITKKLQWFSNSIILSSFCLKRKKQTQFLKKIIFLKEEYDMKHITLELCDYGCLEIFF